MQLDGPTDATLPSINVFTVPHPTSVACATLAGPCAGTCPPAKGVARFGNNEGHCYFFYGHTTTTATIHLTSNSVLYCLVAPHATMSVT